MRRRVRTEDGCGRKVVPAPGPRDIGECPPGSGHAEAAGGVAREHAKEGLAQEHVERRREGRQSRRVEGGRAGRKRGGRKGDTAEVKCCNSNCDSSAATRARGHPQERETKKRSRMCVRCTRTWEHARTVTKILQIPPPGTLTPRPALPLPSVRLQTCQRIHTQPPLNRPWGAGRSSQQGPRGQRPAPPRRGRPAAKEYGGGGGDGGESKSDEVVHSRQRFPCQKK